MKEKKKVGILFGGRSSEHEISCITAAAVMEHTDRKKYEVYAIGITRQGAWWLYTGDTDKIRSGEWERDGEHLQAAILSPCTVHHGLLLLDRDTKRYEVCPLDCLIPAVHGENCEDGKLQGLMEASGVPYVGCGTCSSALTMDKAFTKRILEGAGICQAQWLQLEEEEYEGDGAAAVKRVEKNFSYPVFIKPANAGSSKGISKVKSRGELLDAIREAAAIDPKVIVEETVTGREIEVALLDRMENGKRVTRATVCGEIRPDMDFYSYESKYVSDGSVCEIPAKLEESVARQVRETALKIYRLLDCRGLSRADFFVCEDQRIVFNEINTLPGCTSISMYPKLWEHCGLSFEALVDGWIDFALEGERR